MTACTVMSARRGLYATLRFLLFGYLGIEGGNALTLPYLLPSLTVSSNVFYLSWSFPDNQGPVSWRTSLGLVGELVTSNSGKLVVISYQILYLIRRKRSRRYYQADSLHDHCTCHQVPDMQAAQPSPNCLCHLLHTHIPTDTIVLWRSCSLYAPYCRMPRRTGRDNSSTKTTKTAVLQTESLQMEGEINKSTQSNIKATLKDLNICAANSSPLRIILM